MARGTDDSPYIYLAQEAAKPGFVCVGFAAESEDSLREIAAIDQVPVEANPLEGGGLIARLTDPNGFSVDVVANISAAPSLTVAERSGLNNGNEKQRLGERVAFADPECSIKRLDHVVLIDDWKTSRTGDQSFVAQSPQGGRTTTGYSLSRLPTHVCHLA